MFVGSINQDVRAILHELAPRWKGRPVYVGCSGNFTVERICAQAGVTELHGCDVSIYTCALGRHLTDRWTPITIKDDSLDWLEPYMEPGLPAIATIMLCTEFLQFHGRTSPYHRRMAGAYAKQWPDLHARTVEKLKTDLDGFQLASFYAGDVMEFVDTVPEDAVLISFPPTYCLAQGERILTADLRWLPAGQIKVGDELFAFDEEPVNGARCRRWKRSVVTHSTPARKMAVQVRLANGESVMCTEDHPWLSDRYPYATGVGTRTWCRADQLKWRYVHKQLRTWSEAHSFDAGWLSRMFDGEGCLSVNDSRKGTCWNLTIAQRRGPVSERVRSILGAYGFTATYDNATRGDGMDHIGVRGGFAEVLRALGTFRPGRLLQNLASKAIEVGPAVRVNTHNARVKVESVERVGMIDIQSISTTSRTYVGEGYLMHNSDGYEKLYARLEESFAWEKPDYKVFNNESFARFTELLMSKRTWMTLRDGPVPMLDQFEIARVQTGARMKPVHVFACEGDARITAVTQNTEPVLVERLEGEITEGVVSLVRISAGQLNHLRSQYLAASIIPSGAQLNLGVLVDGKLAGAIAFSKANYLGGFCDAYMLSDFSIAPKVYPRLSKLILAVALSKEVKVLLEQQMNMRVKTIGTTAFTNKPASQKYRGLFILFNRKEGALNYVGDAGKWSIEEAFQWWRKNHGESTTVASGR